MKATIQVTQGLIEVEGDSQSDLFEAMASTQEVFDELKCGLCGCERIRMVVRKNKDDDKFYEYQCGGMIEVKKDGKTVREACRGYLALGQNKKGGGLFPIRKLVKEGPEAGKPDREAGDFGRHHGWTRFRGLPKDQGKK